ncbi:MAG TPA: hypothetical protein VGI79_16220 [Caulobacteraceae bacterium]|jgi:hypothetical protein
MAVRELDKAPGQTCGKLARNGGCGIWGEHPPSCKAFTCLWRRAEEILPPDLFPPACGFLLALDQTETWPTVIRVCADPDRPSAWDTPPHRVLFTELASRWNCAVVVMDATGRGDLAIAPSGQVFSRFGNPDIFPQDGRMLAVPADHYGADRQPPAQRIEQASVHWRNL